MGEDEGGFVAWEEHILCHERGNRVVHYLLKKPCGELVVAVIGTERSIRHMTYVVSGDFLSAFGTLGSVNASTKWRARREVVEWLAHMVSSPDRSEAADSLTNNSSFASGSCGQNILLDQMGPRQFKVQASIDWSGESWMCAKQLRHYPAFCRKEITVTVHSFVFILGIDDRQYLSYLEDMYEDKKGKKRAKVRWFHHYQDVKDVIPHLNPHPREVFITPNVQVISAECVDSPAVVLTPKHYEKCMAGVGRDSTLGIHICFRQFKSHKLRPFTLAKLRGYANQPILASVDPDIVPRSSNLSGQDDGHDVECVRVGSKRNRNHNGLDKCSRALTKAEPSGTKLTFKLGNKPTENLTVGSQNPVPLKVGEKIELLCQDSGIRGCWFQCKIIKMSSKLVKVKYLDVEDADGLGLLVEWVPAHRVAATDKLGMRCSGRLTIRPCPPKNLASDFTFEIGTPVDSWWSDGWWEGVVTGVGESGTNSVQVYSHGRFLTVEKKAMRASKDWVGGKWVDIKPRPDILSFIPELNVPGKQLSAATVGLSVVNEVHQNPMSEVFDDGGQGLPDSFSRLGLTVNVKDGGNNIGGCDNGDANNKANQV